MNKQTQEEIEKGLQKYTKSPAENLSAEEMQQAIANLVSRHMKFNKREGYLETAILERYGEKTAFQMFAQAIKHIQQGEEEMELE